jgi:hypothetical protein
MNDEFVAERNDSPAFDSTRKRRRGPSAIFTRDAFGS